MPDLTGLQLDEAVACDLFGWYAKPAGQFPMLKGEGWFINDGEPGTARCGFEPYSSTLDAASLVESEIERRGLARKYIGYLLGALWVCDPCCLTTDEVIRIRRATPEQICRAALAAVRGASEKEGVE